MNILIVNGPNLNMLGDREPEIYGRESPADIQSRLEKRAKRAACTLAFFQSNHEGAIIDRLQTAGEFDGIILNPGGLTHTSISIRDTVAALRIPVVEVHISNIFAREEFRRTSLISGVCTGVISGLGTQGYDLALEFLTRRKKRDEV